MSAVCLHSVAMPGASYSELAAPLLPGAAPVIALEIVPPPGYSDPACIKPGPCPCAAVCPLAEVGF